MAKIKKGFEVIKGVKQANEWSVSVLTEGASDIATPDPPSIDKIYDQCIYVHMTNKRSAHIKI